MISIKLDLYKKTRLKYFLSKFKFLSNLIYIKKQD